MMFLKHSVSSRCWRAQVHRLFLSLCLTSKLLDGQHNFNTIHYLLQFAFKLGVGLFFDLKTDADLSVCSKELSAILSFEIVDFFSFLPILVSF